MTTPSATPSARRGELLDATYRYVLEHGLADLSLRPLAAAVGSSPRVLLFLFDSKDGLVRAVLARAREDELAGLAAMRDTGTGSRDLAAVVARTWEWLADPGHRGLLRLWTETYGRSLVDPDGPWGDFARATVRDWLDLLADAAPGPRGPTTTERATAALALLRGAMLDLLATGDDERVGRAVARAADAL